MNTLFFRFQTKFSHPHKYLLHYLASLKHWISDEVWNKYPIAKTSWSILQDSYHDGRILAIGKPLISAACISIALQSFGIQVPFTSETRGKNWYQVFSETITKDTLWETMTLIMDIYTKDGVYIAPISK